MSSRSRKSIGLLTVVAAAIGMLVAAQTASAIIVRPVSATPSNASVVRAYTACNNGTGTPAGETHNPLNLPGYACTPPSIVTPRLTAGGLNGDPINFKGFVKLVENPSATTDVQFPSVAGCDSTLQQTPPVAGACAGNWIQDVRCTAGYDNDLLPPPYSATGTGSTPPPVCNAANSGNLRTNGNPSIQPDYSGSLNVIAVIRITDQVTAALRPPARRPARTTQRSRTSTSRLRRTATSTRLRRSVVRAYRVTPARTRCVVAWRPVSAPTSRSALVAASTTAVSSPLTAVPTVRFRTSSLTATCRCRTPARA